MTSTSRAGRPRIRSRSGHLPTCIPVASKAVRPRAKSVQKTQVKGKGNGKSDMKKPGKTAIVISLDSEESSREVDFPHLPPNQPVDIPSEEPEEPNQPLDIPAEGLGEPEEPNNPNPLPEPPVPMANIQLNWSHFKPDFSGKPEENAEAHLLRTNDWITTHDFPDDQKVRRFCLTLSGEARLWYETLNTQQQQLDWAGLQECFRQQYYKFGNAREQYFHVWRSFHLDEATDTIDGYIQKVKQVAALLNYG